MWDCGVATGGPGQKPVRKKMIRLSDRGYGLWRVNFSSRWLKVAMDSNLAVLFYHLEWTMLLFVSECEFYMIFHKKIFHLINE